MFPTAVVQALECEKFHQVVVSYPKRGKLLYEYSILVHGSSNIRCKLIGATTLVLEGENIPLCIKINHCIIFTLREV